MSENLFKQETKLLDQVKGKTRLNHYSIRTEQTYTDWVKRFILHLSRSQIVSFLSYNLGTHTFKLCLMLPRRWVIVGIHSIGKLWNYHTSFVAISCIVWYSRISTVGINVT